MASWRWVTWAVWPLLGAACSYYDSSLLAPTGEIQTNQGGAAGDDGEGPGGTSGEGPGGAGGGGAGSGGSSGAGGGGAGAGGAGGAGAGAGGAGAAGASGAGVSGSSGQSGVGGSESGDSQLVGCAIKPIGPPSKAPEKKDGVEFVLALHTVDLGENIVNGEPAYKSFGFDLDGYCSCPDDFTCKGSDPDKNRYCDGPNGRDNGGGAMIAGFSSLLQGFGSGALNDNFADGKFTLLFQIKKYNGEADDDEVELAWLLGNNFSDGDQPKWDGNDVWPVQKGTYVEGSNPLAPRYVDTHAYVRNHVLVGTVPGGRLESQEFSIELTSPLMVATLKPPAQPGGQWGIDSGTISARWKTSDILAQLSRINDPLFNQPVCKNSQLYPGVKQQICAYADISADIQSQPNVPCNAISISLRFTAVGAKLGGVDETPPPKSNCAPEQDPATDSCEQ